MNLEEAKNLALPKWPQLFISGPPVDKALAKHIILTTDTFLNSLGSQGGNNRKWEDAVRARMGLPVGYQGNRQSEQIQQALRSAWATSKSLLPYHVHNSWASTAYVGGPHGWCHPDGTIHHTGNVGKWPTVESIHEDLTCIAHRFPQVTLAATLFDGEAQNPDRRPVVTFTVDAGQVRVADLEPGDPGFLDEHYNIDNVDPEPFTSANWMPGRVEQGLPREWVDEFADTVREWVISSLWSLLLGSPSRAMSGGSQ